MKVKLQDFAREKGVTDRAIQKHIQNHAEELAGHFERLGPNGTWLDEYAQEFISGLMYQTPTVIMDAQLAREHEDLQERYLATTEQLAVANKELTVLEAVKGRLVAAETAKSVLEAANATYREEAALAHQKVEQALVEREQARAETLLVQKDLDHAQREAEELRRRAENAEAELAAYKARSFWQRLFG